MALFKFLWLRRFIRKNTTPIPVNKAYLWKKRLSFMYLLLSWNAFGLVMYMCFTGKADWAKYYGLKSDMEANMRSGQSWAQTLGLKKAQVFRISGVIPQDSYEVVDGEIVRPDEKEESS